MNCVNCGASLVAKSNICRYCKALNDTDLRAILHSGRQGPAVDRECPRCREPMGSVSLNVGEDIFIERCERCLGIFFDPGELEAIIDATVKHVYEADHAKIHTLIEEEGNLSSKGMSYVPCPDCGKLMNRSGYGSRSGVLVDKCKEHGVWLDGNELGKILKWAKAGGQIRSHERAESDAQDQTRLQRFQSQLETARELKQPEQEDTSLTDLLSRIFSLF